jgi:hypothetical protein
MTSIHYVFAAAIVFKNRFVEKLCFQFVSCIVHGLHFANKGNIYPFMFMLLGLFFGIFPLTNGQAICFAMI